MYSMAIIVKSLNCEYSMMGSLGDMKLSRFSSIMEAKPGSITFISRSDDDYQKTVNKVSGIVVICKEEFINKDVNKNNIYIFVKEPRLIFARLMTAMLYRKVQFTESFIHPTAFVSNKAKLGNHVHIDAYVIIQDAVIGDYVRIESHTKIHSNVRIGNHVNIHEYCNIGGDGFGYIKNSTNKFEYFPHIGEVIIEDYVDIFPYVNVDKSPLSATIIGAGSKIDHYCHIGHGTMIGTNTLLTPNVTTLGGVKIGDNCNIGCGTVLRENVIVGNNAIIGMCSAVTKNIPESETWVGVPAREIQEFKSINTSLSKIAKINHG